MNYLAEYERLSKVMADNPERKEPGCCYPVPPKEWYDANHQRKQLVRSAILEIFDKVEAHQDWFANQEPLVWEWHLLRHRIGRQEDGSWSTDTITAIDIEEKTWDGNGDVPNLPTYSSRRNLKVGDEYLCLQVLPGAYQQWQYIAITKRQLANTDSVISDVAQWSKTIYDSKATELAKQLEENSAKIAKCEELIKKGVEA